MRTYAYLAISVVLALCPSPADAQFAGVDLEVGARAGVTSFRLWGGGVQSVSARRTGGAFGLFLRADVPGPLSVQTELLYVQEGAQVATTSGEVYAETEEGIRLNATLNYLEVPLLLRVDLDQLSRGPLTTAIVAGPTVSYRTLPIGGLPPAAPRNLQVGVLVGPSLAVNMGPTELSASVRYRVGLTSAYEGSDPIRNRGVAATIGVGL